MQQKPTFDTYHRNAWNVMHKYLTLKSAKTQAMQKDVQEYSHKLVRGVRPTIPDDLPGFDPEYLFLEETIAVLSSQHIKALRELPEANQVHELQGTPAECLAAARANPYCIAHPYALYTALASRAADMPVHVWIDQNGLCSVEKIHDGEHRGT